VGVAAPAFAVSGDGGVTVSGLSGCRCGGPGGGPLKPFRLNVTFANASSSTFAITDPNISITGDFAVLEALRVTTPPQTNSIPPGGKTLSYTFLRGSSSLTVSAVTFAYTSTNTATSAATSGTITMNVTWGTCTDTCA
jgi:hypothetical protein